MSNHPTVNPMRDRSTPPHPGTPPTVLVADPLRISRVACPPQPVTEQRFCKPPCSPLGFVDTRLVLDVADEPLNPGAQLVHVIVVTLDPVSADWAPAWSVSLLASGSQIVARWAPGHVGDRVLRNRTSLGGTVLTNGGVPKADRDEMVTRFPTDDVAAPALFVLSLNAGGTGLTLTAANHIVHVDRWWNAAVEDQATDRAFRIGQRRASQVRRFFCSGTIEEMIAGMIGPRVVTRPALSAAASGG